MNRDGHVKEKMKHRDKSLWNPFWLRFLEICYWITDEDLEGENITKVLPFVKKQDVNNWEVGKNIYPQKREKLGKYLRKNGADDDVIRYLFLGDGTFRPIPPKVDRVEWGDE